MHIICYLYPTQKYKMLSDFLDASLDAPNTHNQDHSEWLETFFQFVWNKKQEHLVYDHLDFEVGRYTVEKRFLKNRIV